MARYVDVNRTTTVREFSGGWNAIDSDLNLNSKYAKKFENIWRAPDGSAAVRYGTTLFKKIKSQFASDAYPIGMFYFNSRIVVVGSDGVVCSVTGSGTIAKLWPRVGIDPWHRATYSTAAQFKGRMIICNGIDKPIVIDKDYLCNYLLDDGTGSNINVPICKYVLTASRYLLMAGNLEKPSTLFISGIDAPGTFYGSPTTDATDIDLGSYLTNDDFTIRSISQFRGKIIVGFTNSVIIGTIGIIDAETGIHKPTFDEVIEGYGSVSHGSIQTLGDDVLFIDLVGVPTLVRTTLTGTLRPQRASQLIDPEIQQALNQLNFTSLRENVFSVYNQRDGQYMLFIPNSNSPTTTTATKCFVQTSIPTLSINAWSLFTGWNFRAATRSAQGRVFFIDNAFSIYLYGSQDDPSYADFIGDTDYSVDGEAINFDWELPWSDLKQRMLLKKTRYISFDTKGAGEFVCSFFVDNLYKGPDGELTPQLSMAFFGGDAPGFGGTIQPYGGGRRGGDERLWIWPAAFKIFKLKFTGSTKLPLQFIAISLAYQMGNIRR